MSWDIQARVAHASRVPLYFQLLIGEILFSLFNQVPDIQAGPWAPDS